MTDFPPELIAAMLDAFADAYNRGATDMDAMSSALEAVHFAEAERVIEAARLVADKEDWYTTHNTERRIEHLAVVLRALDEARGRGASKDVQSGTT